MAEVVKPETSNLVGKLETNVEIKAPAGKFHHMFAGRPQLEIFKAVNCMKAIGAKSVLSSSGTTFMANGEEKVAEERVEATEPEKNLITLRVIEGDLMKEYKTFLITIQVTPKQGGPGSIVNLEYEKISEEVAHPETLFQFCVDQHLLSEE